jgi:hypothetical protein
LFSVGDRVHFRTWPSGNPLRSIVGTVVEVKPELRFPFAVQWDGVDYSVFVPTDYEHAELAPLQEV